MFLKFRITSEISIMQKLFARQAVLHEALNKWIFTNKILKTRCYNNRNTVHIKRNTMTQRNEDYLATELRSEQTDHQSFDLLVSYNSRLYILIAKL